MSGSVEVVWSDWKNASLCLLRWEELPQEELKKVCVVLVLKHFVKLYTWLYGSSDGGLGFPHPLHHAFQLFCSSLRRHLWRFDDSIVGVINPETHITLHSELVDHT